jgi:hypothetical protein
VRVQTCDRGEHRDRRTRHDDAGNDKKDENRIMSGGNSEHPKTAHHLARDAGNGLEIDIR